MDRIGAGTTRRSEDRRNVQIGRHAGGAGELDGFVRFAHGEAPGVRGMVDDDARQAESAQRADDAHGDLAAVGDQDLADRHLGSSQSCFCPKSISVIEYGR